MIDRDDRSGTQQQQLMIYVSMKTYAIEVNNIYLSFYNHAPFVSPSHPMLRNLGFKIYQTRLDLNTGELIQLEVLDHPMDLA